MLKTTLVLCLLYLYKVEKILKGSLDLIPSPSPPVKIQIIGGKVCVRCEGKTLLGIVNKLLKTKCLSTSPLQCFALLPEINFPTNNLNFHWRWRWCDPIKMIFLNLFYFSRSWTLLELLWLNKMVWCPTVFSTQQE